MTGVVRTMSPIELNRTMSILRIRVADFALKVLKPTGEYFYIDTDDFYMLVPLAYMNWPNVV